MTSDEALSDKPTGGTTEAEHLYRLMVENIKDYAIFATDAEGRIVSWNAGVRSLLGYEEAEFIGQHGSLIFTPEDIERGAPIQEMRQAESDGRAEDKRWHLRRDGSRFWANGLLMALRDDEGRLRGFAKVMRDETEVKRAEEERERLLRELAGERLRLDQILQQIPAGISIVEAPSGRRLFINEEAERLLGHKVTRGADYTDYTNFKGLHLDGRPYKPDEYPTVRALLTGETIKGEEMLYARGENELATLSVNSTPIRDASGRVVAVATIFTDLTGARRAEAERERFFALGSDLLVIAGFDGYFRWVSPAWERTFGWTAQELTEHPWLHFTHPDDHERTIREAEKLIKGHSTVSFENRYLHKDGSYRWISWNTRSYPQEQLLYSAATDITERKEAEEALRENEERLRLALEAGKMGTWRYDPRTGLVELGERMRAIWGAHGSRTLTLAEVLARIHPEDREAVAQAVATALNPLSSGSYAMDYRIVLPDGEVRWLAANGQAQFAREGGPRSAVGFIGTALDITERKRVEEVLRESEHQLRTLANAAPQLVWMAEPDGHIFWYNRRWYEYTGTTPEQMEGWGWQSVHDPEMLPQVIERWKASLQTGEPFEMEFPLKGADGRFRWFLTRVNPLRDSEGRILRWFGTNTDIEELRNVRKAAEDANRLKDEFLATLSHELRTPLTAILGWSNMLLGGQLNADVTRQALETVHRNARMQAQLIDDLLDVSRIITGKLRLNVHSLELSEVINAAAATVRPAAEAKNIRLQIFFDSGPVLISGDSDRLQQVVWNLLSNAVKFTSEGGSVEVRLRRADSHAEISVSDTGRGISAEMLPHVFERFRQADSSSTRAHGGLGLGLAIVRHLVELHGGAVSAESPGLREGATFTVKLPLTVTQEAQISEGVEAKESRTPAVGDMETYCPPELDGLHVLVVDDEEDTRALLSTVLTNCGAKVMAAGSAQEALEQIKQNRFDVLLSDIGMPGQDGYALIRQVRRLPKEQGGQIPAVALTAYARPEDRLKALRAGFKMHVPKPVEPAELVTVVASLAGRHHED